jgi:23S rRNA (guanine2445-N2)-methyltransferase / 23S rRNA (guanine2069-N7)-methyltransferase
MAWGSDEDEAAIGRARANAERLHMSGFFQFEQCAIDQAVPPKAATGLLVTNPPYGERLGDLPSLAAVYRDLGQLLRTHLSGWRFAMITSNADLAAETGFKPEQRVVARNGAIECEIWTLTVAASSEPELPVLDEARLEEWRSAFSNRLAKNRRKLKGWLKQSGTTAYRLYDADIPEFAVAVDRYDDWCHVSEYAPPADVNTVHAAWRMKLVKEVLLAQEGIAADRLVIKTRERQRGQSQYEKQSSQHKETYIQEGPAKFIVNLTDYLDTGLFLDHRPLRRIIAKEVAGKRFLNLFCYTAAVTVQAALGGASESLSVDMSNTYLDWARDNFQLNGMNIYRHRVHRADCMEWLASDEEQFDVILLDPPSFSNSKRMEGTLDVQRDHVMLIDGAMKHLSEGGTLFFSTNRKKFRLDALLEKRYSVVDITRDTLDPDFDRQPPIHRCWRITRAATPNV